jgi:hypothetical protein
MRKEPVIGVAFTCRIGKLIRTSQDVARWRALCASGVSSNPEDYMKGKEYEALKQILKVLLVILSICAIFNLFFPGSFPPRCDRSKPGTCAEQYVDMQNERL